MSKNLVFFGNERLSTGFAPQGAPVLEALIAAGYTISAVVANHEKGISRNARELEIEHIAKAHHIPVLLPARPTDVQEQLAQYGAVAGMLVAYGKIIPQSIIDIFPKGIINIHPSLLPKYRGPTPIEQVLLDGVTKTGVSIMQLVKAMDAGPLYAQAELALAGSEKKYDLTSSLLLKGKELLLEHLPKILDNVITPTLQDEAQASYCSLIKKDAGIMNWTKEAAILEREVRAYFGWPKSKATLFGHKVTVLASRVVAAQNDGMLVMPCGNETFLEILELIAPSGRRMTGADFLRGYKPRP